MNTIKGINARALTSVLSSIVPDKSDRNDLIMPQLNAVINTLEYSKDNDKDPNKKDTLLYLPKTLVPSSYINGIKYNSDRISSKGNRLFISDLDLNYNDQDIDVSDLYFIDYQRKINTKAIPDSKEIFIDVDSNIPREYLSISKIPDITIDAIYIESTNLVVSSKSNQTISRLRVRFNDNVYNLGSNIVVDPIKVDKLKLDTILKSVISNNLSIPRLLSESGVVPYHTRVLPDYSNTIYLVTFNKFTRYTSISGTISYYDIGKVVYLAESFDLSIPLPIDDNYEILVNDCKLMFIGNEDMGGDTIISQMIATPPIGCSMCSIDDLIIKEYD